MAKNEAKIRFSAETGEFNDSIKKANDRMSELRAELKLNEEQMKTNGTTVEGLEDKHRILSEQLEAAADKTEALRKKAEKAAEIYGENSTEASKMRTQLLNAQTAEERLQRAINECTDEIDAQRNGFDDVADSARDADEGFTILKGTIADLASNAIQGAIGKVGEFVGYLTSLPSATMELRQDMGTLTTAFDNVGMSTEVAKDTWKELYAVFGEDDRAVETANNIARMADSQEELNDWVTITTGVWATYQDSLPVEGLAEASAETAKTGTVTGGLADALNWSSEAAVMFADYMSDDVVTAEDAFNVALSECANEQERQALITDTLTKLYGKSADTYRETTGAQMEAKEATAEQILAEANLATALEPVTTKFTEFKSILMQAALPAIEKVSGAMVSAMDWMREHPTLMKSIGVALGVVTTALTILAAAVGVYTIAQWAMNSAILANPITWWVVGIVALVAVIAGLAVAAVEYWDEIVAVFKSAGESIMSALQGAWEWTSSLFSSIVSWIDTNVIQPVVAFFVGLWTKLQEIWTSIVNVVQIAFALIGSIINAAIQIITLPFMFIWENCKEYVFQAFEWIKEKISIAIEFISGIVSAGFELIRQYIINPIQSVYQSAVEIFELIKAAIVTKVTEVKDRAVAIFNTLRDTAATIFGVIHERIVTPIQNAKASVVSAIQILKNNVESKISAMRDKVSGIFTSIKEKITKPIEEAKTKISGIVDAIKGMFSGMKLSFPNIKMPHFSISPRGWQIGDLLEGSIPSLSISWYKDGGIFTKPTIFNTPFGLKGVGEAGAEAVLPIDRLEGYIAGAIERTMQVADVQALADAIEDLANRPIMLNVNGRNFATATANDTDNVNGLRTSLKSRGLVLG